MATMAILESSNQGRRQRSSAKGSDSATATICEVTPARPRAGALSDAPAAMAHRPPEAASRPDGSLCIYGYGR